VFKENLGEIPILSLWQVLEGIGLPEAETTNGIGAAGGSRSLYHPP
jgi:hypothetical protein